MKSPVVPELQIISPAVFAAAQWKLAEADAAYAARAMFLAKERVYPCSMPRVFGRRDLLEAACWRLHSEGHWRRIVRALKSGSPNTLRGADVSLFERYWSPARTFKLGGRKLDAAAVKAKLAEIEALVSLGCTSREAAARASVPYTTYIGWRTNPVLKGVE